MEIYTNGTEEQRTVVLEVPLTPSSGTMQVVAQRNGVDVHTFNTVTAVPGVGFSVVIPYRLTQAGGFVTIKWSFIYTEDGVPVPFEYYQQVEVVTPLLKNAEVLKIHPQATPQEVIDIERLVRHIINAHTGQKFTRYVGTHTLRGNGTSAILLPERLISLKSINGSTTYVAQVDPGGFILRVSHPGVPPVKADWRGLHMHVGGVIHNPNNIRPGQWAVGAAYVVDGVWGYEVVPPAVKEAAKLLVDDYARVDSAYRNRYLTSMTAADWRIQFNEGAFAKTGNVLADQLLSDYVLQRGWVVV